MIQIDPRLRMRMQETKWPIIGGFAAWVLTGIGMDLVAIEPNILESVISILVGGGVFHLILRGQGGMR